MPKVRELVPQSNESDLFRVGSFALIIDCEVWEGIGVFWREKGDFCPGRTLVHRNGSGTLRFFQSRNQGLLAAAYKNFAGTDAKSDK